jgi:hypothetical protein
LSLALVLAPLTNAAKADQQLDRLILCSAIFNASLALATNDALKQDYQNQTLRYAKRALERARTLGMTEESFTQRAAELGSSTSIEEGDLAAERGRCLNDAPPAGQ